MAKRRKSNRETKKPKAPSDGTKKQNKDLSRHDSSVTHLFKTPPREHPVAAS
jgi:hypothetical protein